MYKFIYHLDSFIFNQYNLFIKYLKSKGGNYDKKLVKLQFYRRIDILKLITCKHTMKNMNKLYS